MAMRQKRGPFFGFNPWALGAMIFVLAFFSRAVFYFVFRKEFNFLEINHWLTIAKNLISGAGYSENVLLTYFPTAGLEPTAARGPVPVLVLSFWLLLFRHAYEGPLYVYSWALSSATAVALYFMARKILGSAKAAAVTALLYCFYLPEMFIASAYAAASESLFTFLLMGYFAAVLRSRETGRMAWAMAAGGLLGLCVLSRPVVFFLPLLYLAYALRAARAKAFSSLLAFFLCFFAVLLPWAIRNHRVLHKPVLTTTLGGYNLFRHNGMLARNEFRIYTAEDFLPYARQAAEKTGSPLESLSEVRLDEIFRKEACAVIRAYPGRYLKLCLLRTVWLWYKINGDRPLFLAQNILIYSGMFPGFVLAFALRHRLRFFVWHFFYFIFAHAAINAQFRFICPMMPYGIMIAVFMWATSGNFLLRKSSRV
jgi:hypothetical protein